MDYYKEISDAQDLLREWRFDSCAMKCGKIFENALKQMLRTFIETVADGESRSIIERKLNLLRKSSIDQLKLADIVRLFEDTGALVKIVKKSIRNRRDLEIIDLKKMLSLRNVSAHEVRQNTEEEAESDAYIMLGSLLKLLKISGLLPECQHLPKEEVYEEKLPSVEHSPDIDTMEALRRVDVTESKAESSGSQIVTHDAIESRVSPPIKSAAETHPMPKERPVGAEKNPKIRVYDVRQDRYLDTPTQQNATRSGEETVHPPRVPSSPEHSDHRPLVKDSEPTTSPQNQASVSKGTISKKHPNVLREEPNETKKPISQPTLSGQQKGSSPFCKEDTIPLLPFRSHLEIRLRQIYAVIYYMRSGYEFYDATKKTLRLFPNVRDRTTIIDACARRFAGDVGTFIRWFESDEILEQLSRSRTLGLSDHDIRIFKDLCHGMTSTQTGSQVKPTFKTHVKKEKVILVKRRKH